MLSVHVVIALLRTFVCGKSLYFKVVLMKMFVISISCVYCVTYMSFSFKICVYYILFLTGLLL